MKVDGETDVTYSDNTTLAKNENKANSGYFSMQVVHASSCASWPL